MSDHQATAQDHPFVIVLGIDLRDQDSSGYAFDQAMRMASRIAGSEAHVVYAVDEPNDQKLHETVELLELYVSEKSSALGIRGPRRAGIHVRRGDAAKAIVQLATDMAADLIVVGSRGNHISSLWLGSTAGRVMAQTSCPVFVAGPKPKPQPSQVITIEPPCPDCIQKRFETQGSRWWCERHSENHHLHRHHVYSYHMDFPFAEHDSEVTAIGTD
jgi:nucleotide-binding universal stress UspA family protein